MSTVSVFERGTNIIFCIVNFYSSWIQIFYTFINIIIPVLTEFQSLLDYYRCGCIFCLFIVDRTHGKTTRKMWVYTYIIVPTSKSVIIFNRKILEFNPKLPLVQIICAVLAVGTLFYLTVSSHIIRFVNVCVAINYKIKYSIL